MTSSADWDISRSAGLDDLLLAAVRTLAVAVERADGAPPLDEHAELQLTHAQPGTQHLLIRRRGSAERGREVLGYAQVQNLRPETATEAGTGTDEDPAAEVLVGLAHRPAMAAALFTAAEDLVGPRPLTVWARGETTPVRAEADARGYHPQRTLLTMARPLAGTDSPDAAGAASLPDGVSIRAFVPGQDDAAWLGVNARSFASHPEQGRWTQADLDDRIAQPWFDPAGFLLLVQDDTVIGFHWTKQHAPESPSATPVTEVYVIGLDPSAQGRGLSRPLLVAGLYHLRATGAHTVILYVDEENAGAVQLYEKTGFTVTRRQTQFRRPSPA